MTALGASHPDTAGSQLGEALALNKLGAYRGAETLLRSAIATFSSQLGPQHWRTANAQTYLGMVLTNQRRFAEAREVLAEAERTLLASLGPDHYRTKAAHNALASAVQPDDPDRRTKSTSP